MGLEESPSRRAPRRESSSSVGFGELRHAAVEDLHDRGDLEIV